MGIALRDARGISYKMATPSYPWMSVAQMNLGLHETAGAGNNPTILGWIKRLGAKVLGVAPKDDLTPWCGTFVAMCMSIGLPGEPLPAVAIRASSWASFGRTLGMSPAYGCVMVFARPGGGHVAFYVGEDDTAYHVLGGNQSDAVTVTRIDKSRCIAMRWPTTQKLLTKDFHRIRLKPDGTPISTDEA